VSPFAVGNGADGPGTPGDRLDAGVALVGHDDRGVAEQGEAGGAEQFPGSGSLPGESVDRSVLVHPVQLAVPAIQYEHGIAGSGFEGYRLEQLQRGHRVHPHDGRSRFPVVARARRGGKAAQAPSDE
jgi:hypothetical protein